MQSLESIAQKIQPGVVIGFEKIGPDPEPVNREGLLAFHFDLIFHDSLPTFIE